MVHKTRVNVCVLSISSTVPANAKAGPYQRPYQLRPIAVSVCIVMMLHTHTASRVALGGRLDASTGWGCVLYLFIARPPMESPRGSLSFASKGKR
jgi:hypothetical protein